ncbi:DUF2207 domain-containing protein [Methylobrevis albus]|uniref:DUF2207 domain-containing protein n=1 Tax=Methylobrevis albus TaxID=2793297 RepID=A0A931I0K5_9HYPH|nr:DUF2207 domain-containing protein [Methylobrevis albus]MBH0237522.1 DUF2207 domain-containing protein [Methylobrevis albus]
MSRPSLGPAALGLLLLLVAGLLTARPAAAEEVLTRFVQTVEVGSDDRLLVTEDITATVEGNTIRRGIYRDFPLRFEDAGGSIRRVGFDVLSVERDGAPEPYSVNTSGGDARIMIGDADVLLAHGEHRWTIRYATTRQIRRFADYDELYWNVNGNEWTLPIDRVIARVRLPDGVAPIRWDFYTGPFGATGKDATATQDPDGSLLFQTTRRLGPGEGLTIAVAIPKDVVAEPDASARAGYALLDHGREIVGGLGLLVVLAYYLWAWRLVGRDPPRGTVIPLFEPPDGMSPALVHYVHERGLAGGGWTAISAAALDLAVRGLVRFEDFGGGITLVRTEAPVVAGLGKAEAELLSWLGAPGTRSSITRANGPAVANLGKRFRGAIEAENRNRFFRKNHLYVLLGLVLSLAAMAAVWLFGGANEEDLAFVVPMLFLSVAIGNLAVRLGRMSKGGLMQRIHAAFLAGLIGLLGAGGLAALGGAALLFDPVTPALLSAHVVVNALFFYLLGAPTALGAKVMDRIEGFRLYLSVAERERLNMAGAPEMSPTRFETMLPYAVALGVEKPWSDAFQAWLTTAAAAGAAAAAYQPAWFAGHGDPGRIVRSVASTASGMAASFSSAVPPPKSSSSGSGGGGSSGGGGGGGGGGGW